MVKTAVSLIQPNTAHTVRRSSKKWRATDERPAKTHETLWRRYQDSWYPETTALFLSISCLVAVATILHRYDGLPNPKMKWGLTLNAVISILATTSKVSLMFTVSNSIGQLKWVWFLGEEARSLLDAGTYDDASRGPLGSMIMLWTEARKSIASIGAILTLLVVAYDPFVQQIVSFEAVSLLQTTPNEDAVMNSAHSFLVDYDRNMPPGAPGFVRPALQSAYWGGDFTWNPSCPSQNCTWAPAFETLAWHTKCYKDENWTLSADCSLPLTVSDVEAVPIGATHVFNCTANSADPFSPTQNTNNISLAMSYTRQSPTTPSDITLIYNGAQFTVLSTHDIYSAYVSNYLHLNESAANFSQPIMLMSTFDLILHSDYSMILNVTTCELDILLDSYTVETKQGTPVVKFLTSTSLIKGFTQSLKADVGVELRFYPSTTSQNIFFADQDQNISFPNQEPKISTESYSRSGYQLDAIYNLISTINDDFPLEMNLTYPINIEDALNDPAKMNEFVLDPLIGVNDTSWGMPAGYSMEYNEAYLWKYKGPEYFMNNLAASLNKIMLDPTQNPNGTHPVYGTTSLPVTLVRVTWWWATLPFGLCVSAVLFLLTTIRVSMKAGAPLWKSSINAFFYHGIDFDSGIWTPLATIPEMDAQAAKMRAKLAPVGISERLMLATSTARN